MRAFHHIGLITDTAKPGEQYFEKLKVWGTDPSADPNKVEWVRFSPESPLASTPVAKMPHIMGRYDRNEFGALPAFRRRNDIGQPRLYPR